MIPSYSKNTILHFIVRLIKRYNNVKDNDFIRKKLRRLRSDNNIIEFVKITRTRHSPIFPRAFFLQFSFGAYDIYELLLK